ncbi:hypothetical protein LNV08_05565 [Paucibacter sp. TC2R-5]|uniref:hypothetical protein n=1 Tax=Paucibacter sp. TC2R-5 TaxID=2893555 RepID=UPI0021E386E4|nr:hypothetical protein [Paucibacter sp. TC2R-5]MCV2358438.1 hypothetical protein [Paucibacter sp. TC2R-5]
MSLETRTRGLLQALLLTAAACVGFAAPQAAQAYEDGWRTCAEENETCRVSGRAMVRYGADGRWTNRTVSNNVDCNNDTFGDPAPGVPKRCQVRTSGNDGNGNYPGSAMGWSFCAAEGEYCQFKGSAEVRFGQGNRFVSRTAYGGVRCDVSDFGDPVRGVTKFCEIRRSGNQGHENSNQGSWAGWGSGSSSKGWRYCAAENDTCRIKGNGQVRFGDGHNWKMRSARSDVACNVRNFGDPADGVLKHCEVQVGNYGGDGDSDSGSWTRCAAENENCDFRGFAQVRYGASGRYVYRDGTNGIPCRNNYFGADPYPGRVKACEIKR